MYLPTLNGGENMLFRRKQPRACAYCKHSTALSDGQVLCAKRGIKLQDDACCRFRYDPIKRIPPKNNPLDLTRYNNDDFSL